MAVTELQAPSSGQPISRPLLHYVSSNQTSYSDFYYIIEVYYYPYGGTPGVAVLIGKFKVFPDPTYSRGLLDVSKIIKGYLQTAFTPTQELLAWSSDKINVQYAVKYAEYYNGAEHYPGTWTFTAIAAYYYWSDIINASILPSYPTAHQWLTDRDTTQMKVPRQKNFFLPFNNSRFGTIYNTQQIHIDAINTSTSQSDNFDRTTDKQACQLNLNSDVIKYVFDNEFSIDIDSVVPDYHLDIKARNTHTPLVTTSTATLTYTCPKAATIQLHFLNRYGVFETMSFEATNRMTQSVERKQYKRSGIELSSSYVNEFSSFETSSDLGSSYIFSTKDTSFYTKQDYGYKLMSDYVNEQDYYWLKQLIASPLVYADYYIPNQQSNYFPVTIKTAQWEQKFSGQDKVFNLELEINAGQIII